MKLEDQEFASYRIVVETLEEHKFLLGLFSAGDIVVKKDCTSSLYNYKLDQQFFELLEKIKI